MGRKHQTWLQQSSAPLYMKSPPPTRLPLTRPKKSSSRQLTRIFPCFMVGSFHFMVQSFIKGQSMFVNYSCFQMSELQISRSWIRIVFSIWHLEGGKLQNPITEWKKGVHVLLGCDWVRDGSDWAKSLGTTDSTPTRPLQYQGKKRYIYDICHKCVGPLGHYSVTKFHQVPNTFNTIMSSCFSVLGHFCGGIVKKVTLYPV